MSPCRPLDARPSNRHTRFAPAPAPRMAMHVQPREHSPSRPRELSLSRQLLWPSPQPPRAIMGRARPPRSWSSCMSRLPPSLKFLRPTPSAIAAATARSSLPSRMTSRRLQKSSPKRQFRSCPSEVRRMRLQPPQKASVMLAMTPIRPFHPGTLQMRATSWGVSGAQRSTVVPRLSACLCTISMMSACDTSLFALHPFLTNGMNSKKRTSMGRCSVRSMKAPTSSSFTPFRSTQLSFRLKSSCAATSCTVFMTRSCHSTDLRASRGNFAGMSVSRLRLMLLNPAARSCGRNFERRTPLVVMPRFSPPGTWELTSPRSSTMRPKSLRIVGSPPVSRTLRTPMVTKRLTRRWISWAVSFSPSAVGSMSSSPSSGMQYLHLRLQRSVRDTRRYRWRRPKLSTSAGSMSTARSTGLPKDSRNPGGGILTEGGTGSMEPTAAMALLRVPRRRTGAGV
mmetsp:Transcript_52073/g.113824  ORF Transcript_52073/g.113824 Transcript_52073/m.113824 type:complete len:452 (+) Transcript_52073:192-1547(+)